MFRKKTESLETSSATSEKKVKKNWTPYLIMGAIIFLAAFVRVFFAYGTSAGSDFALSGGSMSTNNVNVIHNFFTDGLFSMIGDGFGSLFSGTPMFNDPSQFYPYGSATSAPALFDIIIYPFAIIFDMILVDQYASINLALGLSGPVFGILSCIPMYLLGKELMGSKLAGYISALFLALCPIAISTTVFSNGTGTSFVLFTFLFSAYFLVKAINKVKVNEEAPLGKEIFVNALLSGLFFAIASASWTEFRAILIPLIVVMVVQMFIDRFKNRDATKMVTLYSFVIVVGTLLAGAYYAIF